MNIKMIYLYRDGGNYKQWYEVVFANPESLSLADVTRKLKDKLVSGMYFETLHAPIPIESTEDYDPELDHNWLEFYSLEEVDESTPVEEDVRDFLARL